MYRDREGKQNPLREDHIHYGQLKGNTFYDVTARSFSLPLAKRNELRSSAQRSLEVSFLTIDIRDCNAINDGRDELPQPEQ